MANLGRKGILITARIIKQRGGLAQPTKRGKTQSQRRRKDYFSQVREIKRLRIFGGENLRGKRQERKGTKFLQAGNKWQNGGWWEAF